MGQLDLVSKGIIPKYYHVIFKVQNNVNTLFHIPEPIFNSLHLNLLHFRTQGVMISYKTVS